MALPDTWHLDQIRKEKDAAKRTRPPTPTTRSTRHTLTLRAATVSDRPEARIESLKGGELVWSVRVPAASTKRAVDVALEQAARLRETVASWQTAPSDLLIAPLRASIQAAREKKEATP